MLVGAEFTSSRAHRANAKIYLILHIRFKFKVGWVLCLVPPLDIASSTSTSTPLEPPWSLDIPLHLLRLTL